MTPRPVSLGAFMLAILSLALPEGGRAAKDPGQRCAAAKLKAATRETCAKAECYREAVAASVPVDAACLAKAATKFAKAFADAERKSGCATLGDAAVIEVKVDAFLADLVNEIPATTSTSTTTIHPVTTTTRRVTTTTTSTTTMPPVTTTTIPGVTTTTIPHQAPTCIGVHTACGSCGNGVCQPKLPEQVDLVCTFQAEPFCFGDCFSSDDCSPDTVCVGSSGNLGRCCEPCF